MSMSVQNYGSAPPLHSAVDDDDEEDDGGCLNVVDPQNNPPKPISMADEEDDI